MKLSVLCVSIACLFVMVSVCAQAQHCCNDVLNSFSNPPHVTTGNYNSGVSASMHSTGIPQAITTRASGMERSSLILRDGKIRPAALWL
jgi:hypothetical protein